MFIVVVHRTPSESGAMYFRNTLYLWKYKNGIHNIKPLLSQCQPHLHVVFLVITIEAVVVQPLHQVGRKCLYSTKEVKVFGSVH
jgi:hypothetical protein